MESKEVMEPEKASKDGTILKVDVSSDGIKYKPKIMKTISAGSSGHAEETIITYSAEELTSYQSATASSAWPKFLDESYKNSRGNWDPDRWYQGHKPQLEEGGNKRDEDNGERPSSSLSIERKLGKKALKDPKEMLKLEQQDGGLVLGPRRRSFNTGCQMAQPAAEKEKESNTRQKEIKELKERAAARLRDETRGDSRRVGSGRILTRERDRDEFEVGNNRRFDRATDRGGDYSYRTRREEDDSNGRFERGSGWHDRRPDRGYGTDDFQRQRPGDDLRDDLRDDQLDKHRNKRGKRSRGGKFGGHRHMDNEEPEWMNAPVNQDELMELRGFDDSPEKEPNAERREEDLKQQQNPPQGDDKLGEVLGEVLHLDSIPGLSNILGEDDGKQNTQLNKETAGAGGSRFSQFFQRTKNDELPRDEMAKQLHQQQPSIRIPSPGDPGACFAPISPAAKTTNNNNVGKDQEPNLLMDMLRSGAKAGKDLSGIPPDLLRGKNVKSVNELEADIKQFGRFPIDQQQQQQQQRPLAAKDSGNQVDGDLSAFKKFAAMVEMNKADEAFPSSRQQQMHPPQAPPNFQMRQPNIGGGLIRPMPMPSHPMMEEGLMMGRLPVPGMPPPMGNIRSHQQHQTGGYYPNEAQMQQGMLVLIHNAPMNLEVLKKPEARSLQSCLERGNVTPDILLHQFIHGNLDPFEREILLNVLKIAQNQGLLGPIPDVAQRNHSPSVSPHPDPFMLLVQQQQQQQQGQQRVSPRNNLSVSPLPGQQRVPSPQELMVHTQQIMQNALIKRKLKEQEESYRKRMDHGKSGGGPGGDQGMESAIKSNDSPTSLAFAPTVVMKKMAADRRDSDPKLILPELKVSQASQRESSIGPHGDSGSKDDSVRILEQLTAQQQRMPHPPLPNGNNPMMMMHQIRAQQMQQLAAVRAAAAAAGGQPPNIDPRFMRPRHPSGGAVGFQPHPQQPPQAIGGSGGPSPSSMILGQGGLSRFFSPEVLAQANSGNAPTMPPLPTQKAMTLEEIERHAATVRM